MQRNTRFYFDLFATTFSLSAFTFGGGYVIVPLMRKRFVEEKQWLNEREMLDIVAIGQSAPGLIAVNVSIMAGYRLAGILGALVTTLGTVLPPLITISVISFFYASFRDNAAVAAVMKAMQAGVAAVIVDAVFGLGKSAANGKNPVVYALMAACFCAAFFFKVNVALIIVICGFIGAAASIFRGRKMKGGGGA